MLNLHRITWPDGHTYDGQAMSLLKEDPVRPHISKLDRVIKNREVLYLLSNSGKIDAIVCISINDKQAISEEDLYSWRYEEKKDVENMFAHLYTVWSYSKGAGRDIAFAAIEYIKYTYPNVKRILTLSPKTEMAKKFHLKNGAIELQVNEDTVNFEYKIKEI